MNTSLRDRWIAALRSGEYQQGRLMLRDEEDRFCCLGVLCNVADPSGWRGKSHHFGRWSVHWKGPKDPWAYPGDLLEEAVAEHLAELNDDCECTFADIADYLDDHPEIQPKDEAA